MYSESGVGVTNLLAALTYFTPKVPLATSRGKAAHAAAAKLSESLKCPLDVSELLSYLPTAEAPQLRDAGLAFLKGAHRKQLEEADEKGGKRSVTEQLQSIQNVSNSLLTSIDMVAEVASEALTLRSPLPLTVPRLFQRVREVQSALAKAAKKTSGWPATIAAGTERYLECAAAAGVRQPL